MQNGIIHHNSYAKALLVTLWFSALKCLWRCPFSVKQLEMFNSFIFNTTTEIFSVLLPLFWLAGGRWLEVCCHGDWQNLPMGFCDRVCPGDSGPLPSTPFWIRLITPHRGAFTATAIGPFWKKMTHLMAKQLTQKALVDHFLLLFFFFAFCIEQQTFLMP